MGKDKKKKGKGKEKTTDLVVRSAIEVAYNDEADPNSVLRGALEAIGVDELAAAVGYSNPGDIQPMLDENAATIGAIVEYRGMGREDEAAQLLRTLHKNLMQLTSLTNGRNLRVEIIQDPALRFSIRPEILQDPSLPLTSCV